MDRHNSDADVAQFLQFCKEKEVEFVDFRFTDVKGTWNHLGYSVGGVDKDLLQKGIPFDASSIPAWQSIDRSDMILKPDLIRYFLDPFSADITAVVFCDVWDVYKEQDYEKCPRSIAKRALKHLQDLGIADTAYFGAENEFFIFDSIKIKNSANCQYYEIDTEEGEWNRDRSFEGGVNFGHRTGHKGGYLPTPPTDTLVDIRAEIVKVLNQVGLETYVVHHEVAQAQCEIGVRFGNLVEAADNVQKLKYVVKMVAHLNGKTATFMPKPLHGDNGSGMHTHVSLWKGGQNLFSGDVYKNLSQMALHFLGGVLRHARGLAAFTNASSNSYKRLIPGFEAPSILTYSAQNRSASVRIPYGAQGKAARFELRFPDNSSNPYLAFAAILMAGLEGIAQKSDPGKPMDINLFKLTLDEIREKGIKQLPHTLRSALEEMLANKEYLKKGEVFSEEFIQTYQSFKFRSEVFPWESRPHPFEFKTTYSC
ncbi:type I glutamate--ammonia ligase [Helicobacter suis]|uniref:Glutamine synthetase n=2 Tax=Helicobacter suis TaxID=104628 RepID=E7G4R3_9HELI|nr:type I glutamate--ammonia ligase [Helicobacter suis]EFX41628.1 glutamine synthetase [Helicobacter suis HS5]EFX42771.1 glutamine synthetase [Helicobacter suis HS1]BCD45207.1 Glutamine synthetase GlnA [Helicobacter suis]BCD47062.1 Glutamine synthetase GlnA [Helicobacter suis]BCD50598.1 Glutamine synthetase GlnA [Helicobacter suis]